jgi:hypothetical protein
MARPTFAPERGEIWYADGNSGFYAVRVTNDAWPGSGSVGGPEAAPPAVPAPAGDGTAATGAAVPVGLVAGLLLAALAIRRIRGRA